MFVVLVGLSAKGRKGTSQGHVKRVFELVDWDWTSDRMQSGLSSGEGLIWSVRDPIYRPEPVRESKKVTGYQDVVIDQGVTDKRLLVTEGEYASTLRVMGREGNTLSPVIRNAWDSGNLRVLTKNSPAKATGAHISIIGHITKEELLRYLDSTEAGNGFGNRFLWFCVRRSKLLPEGGKLNEIDYGSIARELGVAVRSAKSLGLGCMELSSHTRLIWHQVYPELSEGRPGLLGAMVARAEAQVMRLACIYALLDDSTIVRPEHLRAALAVWRYAEDSAKFIFGASLGNPVADEILLLLRQRPEGATRTEISAHFNRHQQGTEIQRALDILYQYGLARSEAQPTGGRAAERWFAVSMHSSA